MHWLIWEGILISLKCIKCVLYCHSFHFHTFMTCVLWFWGPHLLTTGPFYLSRKDVYYHILTKCLYAFLIHHAYTFFPYKEITAKIYIPRFLTTIKLTYLCCLMLKELWSWWNLTTNNYKMHLTPGHLNYIVEAR